jgi:hypothetical protein
MSMLQVNLWHVLLQGPLLVYIGINKNKSQILAFNSLLLLGLCIPFVVRFPQKNWSQRLKYVNYFHYLIIIPLFLYLGYYGSKNKLTDDKYKLCLYLGTFIIFYHGYKAYNRINNK